MKRLSEQMKIDNAVESQNLGAASTTSAYFDMSEYRKALAILNSGALANGSLVSLELMQAQDSSGTGAKSVNDLDGNPIVVEYTNSTGASVPSVELFAEVQAAIMDTNNGFTHLAVKVTSDDAASQVAVDLLRGDARFMPVQDADASVVA